MVHQRGTILTVNLAGNRRAALAIEVYIHRLRGLVASMAASMAGIDAQVFTGGVGPKVPKQPGPGARSIRSRSAEHAKHGNENSIREPEHRPGGLRGFGAPGEPGAGAGGLAAGGHGFPRPPAPAVQLHRLSRSTLSPARGR